MTVVVTGPNSTSGAIQPGSWRKAGTHWLGAGKDAGGRADNIVEMSGSESPVDVPAAFCE